MTKYEVQCVTMESNPNYHDCRGISTIGIEGNISVTLQKTPAQVYEKIEDGHTVVVEHEGTETEVIKATTEDGTKYVRTEPNDTKDDNLLKQDAC